MSDTERGRRKRPPPRTGGYDAGVDMVDEEDSLKHVTAPPDARESAPRPVMRHSECQADAGTEPERKDAPILTQAKRDPCTYLGLVVIGLLLIAIILIAVLIVR